MSIEELKMVASVINGLGDKAVLGLAVYIGAEFLCTLVEIAAWLALAWMICLRVIPKIVAVVQVQDDVTAAFKTLRDMFTVGCTGDLYPSEIRETLVKIKEHLEKSQS